MTLSIICPDDWHVHLRDGAVTRAVAAYTAGQFRRAIVMPNTVPPITGVEEAIAYRERIMAALTGGPAFTPLMTCYLTDDTRPAELERGFKEKVWTAAKLYPAHATTNSQHGVTSIDAIAPALARMEEIGMPLLVHGEVTDPQIDIFDREAVFIERVLSQILLRYPALRVVMEHVTTADGVAFVRANAPRLAGTITPHHLLLNRNDLLVGGIRPHHYCLPVLKRERHRLALREAATSGDACFFAGTDTAPHTIDTKECAVGCAGLFNAPTAMQSYAQVFHEEGAMDLLEGFVSRHGPAFYGLPLNTERLRLERAPSVAPATVPVAGAEPISVFRGGEELGWTVTREA